jgi:purine-binding chemotaxis protein CheW
MATKELAIIGGNAQPDHLLQLVSFMLDGEEFGLEVLKVREIIRIPTITKMPNTAQYIEGVVNLRGKVIPIISMRKRFGLPDSGNDSQTRIIVMDVANNLTGFIVDGVSEVIRVRSSEINPPPSLVTSGGVSQEFITGIFNHAERLLILLDIDRMFTAQEQGSFSGLTDGEL